MMKWLLVLAGLVVAEAAIARRNVADIPVEIVYEEVPHQLAGVRNLEAKPQLSPEQFAKIVTPDEAAPSETITVVDQVNPYYPAQNVDDLYQKIQEIILSGSNQLRATLGKDVELMQRVNTTFEEFLESTRNLLALRSTNSLKQDQNIFQTILSNFQSAASSLFGSRPQSDEQQSPNPFQTIITQIQNGLSGLAGNSGTQATVLSDATTQAQGPIQFVQNAVQSFQQGVSTFLGGSTSAPGGQQDETTQGGPLQAFQSAIQQIGQNIPNPFQQTTRLPGSQSDEATTQGGPLAFLQNALGNLNPFTQGTTAKPSLASDGSTTAAPGNPLQGIVSQIQGSGNNPIIQQGQNIATQITGGNNPGEQILQQLGNNTATQQIQQQIGELGNNNATQQIQQQLGQLGNNSATQQLQQQLGQLGNNTATQQIQQQLAGNNATQQLQQQLGQLGNPQQLGEQIGGAVQGNPQDIAQQIGQAISGGGSSSTQAPPIRSEGPLQNILSNLNPFRRPTTEASKDEVA